MGENAPDEDRYLEELRRENLVPGTNSRTSIIVMIVSGAMCICFFALALRAGLAYERQEERIGRDDDFRWVDRLDKYNLEAVAVDRRHFWEWAWHPNIWKNGAMRHPGPDRSRVPFEDLGCLCANKNYRNSDNDMHAYCMDAARRSALVRHKNGDDSREFVSCQFTVPYDAIFASLCAASFGFMVVAHYARSVLQEPRGTPAMDELGKRIATASMVFLKEEYKWLLPFVGTLWIYLYTAVDGQQHGWRPDTSVSFLFGALLSAACGYVGMFLATEGNVRTASACAVAVNEGEDGLGAGLKVAFRTGACMGIAVVSFGLFGLALTYAIFGNTTAMGGFGFGASSVALFARVGGGIYTKAADVGGDLCGKVEAALDEDNPKNPATIADCVGDNVGDTAGMGADLFESFVGTIVAASVLGAAEFGEHGVGLPFYIAVIGIVASCIGTYWVWIPKNKDGETGLEELLCALSINVLVSGVIIVCFVFVLCFFYLKDETDYLENIDASMRQSQPGARTGGCVLVGLISGVFIGKITEYFTSHTDAPTRSIALAGEYGPGPVIIQGIGMGMYSTALPMTLIVSTIVGSYYLAGYYGTAIACVGMLSTLGVTMSTDAYGPVSDNAGGIAEMCELPPKVRETTDKLDALGNTTAATGKGFANGSAVLAAVSLLAAYTNAAKLETIDLLKPVVVCGVLLGSLQPYIFAAMTMLSVNKAAQEMMAEVRRQFDTLIDSSGRHILHDDYDGPMPDYDRCIAISTKSALKEMLLPGELAIFCPLIVGFILGADALAGFLLGAIATGYLLGVQMSNTGGAWDNAKKFVEAGELKLKGVIRPKKSLEHAAVVAGDTVGDPFKDTSGPSLNILIKLMTQFSFVTAPLLGREWEFFWMGVVLFVVAAILMLFTKCYVLWEPEEADEEFYHTDAGVKERLSFLDSLLRRMGGDIKKLSKQRIILEDLEEEIKDTSSVGVEEHLWSSWAAKHGVAETAKARRARGEVESK
eukprot:Hpha_TRINITY_DN15114_c3_g4::TRINITY_DN15114_c3_g4_i1::g.127070::m.127070/K15987/hppA; K(+)-stimulated pyrophosphate-energized sodium pump